ncbi:MAG TPA: hypothetical protein VLS28_03655 [Candidatus Sulfomarinibacteraceae bacterium]|nr:hypothetical protein [Candidatus Sulfomarinibacteraceae bacterium]
MPGRLIGRRAVPFVAVIALIAIVAVVASAPATSTATGVVVAVDSRSLTDVDSFTIRTPEGEVIDFTVGALQNGAEFPPGHLVEHIASGVPVVVTYRDGADGRVAIRIVDAPAPSDAPAASSPPAT